MAQNLSWQAHRRDIEHRLLGFTTPGTDTGFAQADRTREIKKWAQCILPAARIDAKKAVELNRRSAGKYGWQAHRDRIMRLLGLTATPDEKGFAIAVAQWQCMQGLEPVDGIIGKNTWQRMLSLIKEECPLRYDSAEREISRTKGYLPSDVILLKGSRLLIADFGVNQSEIKVKAATRDEKLLRDWLHTFETDPSYRLRILGYSDCVGEEKNNKILRGNRAEQVYHLLRKSAQSRVISKGPANLGTYVADNITPIGRAKNRGVTIEFYRAKPEFWVTEPLPPSEFHRFKKAIDDLEIKAYTTQDPRRWRYLCWIEKLKKPDVDDRIIRWSKICPRISGAIGAAFAIGPCDWSQGTPVDQMALERSIRSVSDVEVANKSLQFITYMRSAIVLSYETTSLQLESLRMNTDEAGRAIEKLNEWAFSPTPGSKAMPRAYRAIKTWIIKRQDDPKSLYSCF